MRGTNFHSTGEDAVEQAFVLCLCFFLCSNLHPNPTVEGTEALQHLQDVYFSHRLSTQRGFSKYLTMGKAQVPPNSYGLAADRTSYGAAAGHEAGDEGGGGDIWGSSVLPTHREVF